MCLPYSEDGYVSFLTLDALLFPRDDVFWKAAAEACFQGPVPRGGPSVSDTMVAQWLRHRDLELALLAQVLRLRPASVPRP